MGLNFIGFVNFILDSKLRGFEAIFKSWCKEVSCNVFLGKEALL